MPDTSTLPVEDFGKITAGDNASANIPFSSDGLDYTTASDVVEETYAYTDFNKRMDDAQERATWMNPVLQPQSLSDFALNGLSPDIIGDKWRAFSDMWTNNTYIGQGVEYLQNDYGFLRGEDKPWMEQNNNQDVLFPFMVENGIPLKYYPRFIESKSLEHRQAMLNVTQREEARNKLIQSSLNSTGGIATEAGMSALVGGLADYEAFTGGVLGYAAKMTKMQSTMAAMAVTTNIGAQKMRYDYDPDLSAGEAWSYGMIGSVIDGALVFKLGASDMKQISDVFDDIPNALVTQKLYSSQTRGARAFTNDRALIPYMDEIIDAEVIESRVGTGRLPIAQQLESPLRRKQGELRLQSARAEGRELVPYEQELSDLLDIINDIGSSDKKLAKAEESLRLLQTSGRTTAQRQALERKQEFTEARRQEIVAEAREELKKPVPKAPEGAAEITPYNRELSDLLDVIDNSKSKKTVAKAEDELQLLIETKMTRIERDSLVTSERLLLERRDEAYKALKVEINTRMAIAKTTGFKQLQKAVVRIEKKADSVAKHRELALARERMHDYDAIAREVKMNIAQYKAHIRTLSASESNTLAQELMDYYTQMYKLGHINKSEFEQLGASFAKGGGAQTLKAPKLKVKKQPNGDYRFVNKDGKPWGKPIPTALAMVLLGTTGALAGGDIGTSDVLMGILGMMALGFAVVNAGAIVKSLANRTKMAQIFDKTLSRRAKLSQTINESRTRVSETIKPMMDDGNPAFVDAVHKFYFDPITGRPNVDRLKSMHFSSMHNLMIENLNNYHKQFLSETNVKWLENMSNMFDYTNRSRYMFENELFRVLDEGYVSKHKSVMDASKYLRQFIDEKFKGQIKESGLKYKHFDDTTIKNWMPRYVKSGLGTRLRDTVPAGRTALVVAFSKMLTKSKDPLKTAEVYLDAITNVRSGRSSFKSVDDIDAYFKANGIDGNADELASILGLDGDVWGRAKDRIFMDKSKFQPVATFSHDGSPIVYHIDDLFESSSVEVLSRYIGELSGQLAIVDAGFASPQEVLRLAQQARNPANQARMEIDLNIALGNSPIDMSDPFNQFWTNTRNLTIGLKMKMSVLSLAQELVTTLGRVSGSAWQQGFTNPAKNILDAGTDSLLVQAVAKYTGRGLHQYGASYGAFKTIDEGAVVSSAGTGALSGTYAKGSEALRDFTLFKLGLVKGSDFLESVNLADSTKLLYDYMLGKVKFLDYEKTTFGITPEFDAILAKYRSRFELNSKGQIKDPHFETWDRADRIAYFSVVDNMMQKRIQHATMGTTPAYFRDYTMGQNMGALLGFPISAYSNMGSFMGRGIMAGDPRAMGQSALWFAGGAISSIIRWELDGKDYTSEDILIAAISSHPFNIITPMHGAFTNPAPTGVLEKTTEFVDLYGGH